MTFLAYRFGAKDPTFRLGSTGIYGTTLTGMGEATFHVASKIDTPPVVVASGPGQTAWEQRRERFVGACDTFTQLEEACPKWQMHPSLHPEVAQKVKRLQQKWGHQRMGGSGDTYKAALVATLGQRITVTQAVQQWHLLCRKWGTPTTTPGFEQFGLCFAPLPSVLAELVPYQFHHLGIEEKRATTLIQIGRFFSRPGMLDAKPEMAIPLLEKTVVGFGPWTSALVRREAAGDSDALAVGDFHVKNTIAYFFTGAHRGTDEEMVTTLEPFLGQRGRIVEWLKLEGVHAPQHGPRKRLFPISRL